MINKMILQGRLTADIELRRTQSDVANTEFTIAWSEKYKEVKTRCFMRCKAWRQTAEFLDKYFRKGQEILIEGHMVTEEWEKDGDKKSRTICLIDKVNFCGSKSNNGSNISPKTDVDGFVNIPDDVEDDELPFN